MGFLSKLGATLKNPDLWDGLDAMSMAIDGNPAAAQAMRDRIEQRKFAEQQANIMERQGYGTPNGPIPDMTGATIPVVQELPQRAAPFQMPQPGAPDPAPAAPFGAPNLPMASPAAAAPAPARSLYAQLLPSLLRASGRGVDTSGVSSTLQREDYINSLPMKDQAAARMDPSRFAGWQHDDNKPVYNETSPGNSWNRYDPASKAVETIFTAPNKPAGPLNESEVRAAIIQNHKPGTPYTDEEKIALGYKDEKPNQYGQSQAMADAYNRVSNPAKYGQPSQTDIDMVQAIIAGKKKGDGLAALLGAAGADDEEAPAPAPAAPPGAKALPQKSAAPPAPRAPSKVAPMPGAQKGRDGQWYIKKGQQWFRVDS